MIEIQALPFLVVASPWGPPGRWGMLFLLVTLQGRLWFCWAHFLTKRQGHKRIIMTKTDTYIENQKHTETKRRETKTKRYKDRERQWQRGRPRQRDTEIERRLRQRGRPRQIYLSVKHDRKSGVTCWFSARASLSLVSSCFKLKKWLAACSFFVKIRDNTKSYEKELLLLFWSTSPREAGFSSGGKFGMVVSDLWRSTLLFRQNY